MPTTRAFKFNKYPLLSSLYTSRTSNVLNTVWGYLNRYKSINYTKSRLSNNISINTHLIDKKSEQIAFNIRQAQEFFMTARHADVSIKPLLIYYGIVGLAKCLIISGDNEYTLDATPLDYQEHGHHGLSWRAVGTSQVNIRDSDSLMEEFCTVKAKGVYQLFRGCYADIDIPKDSVVNLKNILSLIGENWRLYYDYYSEPPNVYGSDEPKNGDVKAQGDNIQLLGRFNSYYHLFHRIKSENMEDCLNRLFPELNVLYDKIGDNYQSKSDVTSIDSHIVFSKTQTLEEFALVQPFKNFKLSEFDTYFLLFFILSNLCRYRQDKWYKITNRIVSKDEFFLIENLFDVVQYKYPLLILKELENKDYQFIGEVATYG